MPELPLNMGLENVISVAKIHINNRHLVRKRHQCILNADDVMLIPEVKQSRRVPILGTAVEKILLQLNQNQTQYITWTNKRI